MLTECAFKNIKRFLKSFKWYESKALVKRCVSTENVTNLNSSPRWNVMFFGTDDFSVASLRKLHSAFKDGILVKNLEVVTNVRSKPNAVQEFAVLSKLKLHNWRDLQPSDIQNKLFDVGVVVSFGNLIPSSIINSFPLGILNVHASLLPKWRGAAPIIHALSAGDTETGVTIMKIRPQHFDIGEIITQRTVEITPTILLPDLTNQLAELGGNTLFDTIRHLPTCLDEAWPQPIEGTSYAPRIQQDSSRISWSAMSSIKIYNLYRALKGLFPLQCIWMGHPVKIFEMSLMTDAGAGSKSMNMPGYTVFLKKENQLRIHCLDGNWIIVHKLSVNGRKPINCKDFYNGFMSKYHPKQHVFT